LAAQSCIGDEMPATVLLVEDEVLVRWSLAADLVDMNFEVLEAGTVKQAIEMLEQHASIDLMFSDIKLPGILNGIDLAKTAMKRWPRLKIIMTSGHAFRTEMPFGVEFIDKPYLHQKVATMMRALLAQRGQQWTS
jgi:two-component system, response regulator PdtaR